MTDRPYPIMRLSKGARYRTATHPSVSWKVFLELADIDDRQYQQERLLIETHVPEPRDGHPQGLELAAIRRVHDLLGQQIAAMQSQ